MPLFPAHPAAVLPLQRLGLPLSALVAGAVAPDAPVYLPVPVAYSTTHSGPGLVIDALIGLVLLALWDFLVRDPVVDLLRFLGHRSEAGARLGRRGWTVAPLAVALGAATHVLWDSFTHDWGFVVEAFPALRESAGELPVYSWLQHLSTVVGTLVVAGYCVHRLRSPTTQPCPPAVRRPGPPPGT